MDEQRRAPVTLLQFICARAVKNKSRSCARDGGTASPHAIAQMGAHRALMRNAKILKLNFLLHQANEPASIESTMKVVLPGVPVIAMMLDGIGKIAKHDLKISIRMILSAFSKGRDKLLLLCVTPFAFAAGKAGLGNAQDALLSSGTKGLLLMQTAIALAAILVTRSRINWHRENGIIAPIALRPAALATYSIASLLIGCSLATAMAGVSLKTIGTIIVGVLAAVIEITLFSALAVMISQKIREFSGGFRIDRRTDLGENCRERTWNLIAELTCIPRLGFTGNLIALAIVGTIIGVTLVISQSANFHLSALTFCVVLFAILIALSIMMRLPHSVAKFLLITGVSPFNISMVFTLFNAALLAPAALLFTAMPGAIDRSMILLAFVLTMAAIAAVSTLQVAHYSLRSRRGANIAIQVELAALVLTSSLLGPLIIAPAVARLVLLRRSVLRRKMLLE